MVPRVWHQSCCYAGVAQLTQPGLGNLTCHVLSAAHMAATCLAALQGEASKAEPCPVKLQGTLRQGDVVSGLLHRCEPPQRCNPECQDQSMQAA